MISVKISKYEIKTRTGYRNRQCIKSGKIKHLNSSKYITNPPLQKFEETTSPSNQIFKRLNWVETAISDIEKYREIDKSIGAIKFNKVMN